MGKDIFISHAWGNDNLKRNNHLRCKIIADHLIKKNYGVWFDEYDIYGNIDNSIMKGINNAKVIIICLTQRYCDKVNNAVNNNYLNDNCYKEWSYCLFKQKIIIPVIMDPDMKTIYLQDGIVQMYLNNTIYIDCGNKINIDDIIKQLNIHNVFSNKQLSFNEKIYMPLVVKSLERTIDQLSPKLNSPKNIISPSRKRILAKYIIANNFKNNKRFNKYNLLFCCARKTITI